MTDETKNKHWLVRLTTIRWLWRILVATLALTLVAQFVFPVKGYFGVDGWFGFGAAYGFISCLILVLVAKVAGILLKRNDKYFDDLESDD